MRVRRALLEPVYYRRVREPKQRGWLPRDDDAIESGLRDLGVDVREWEADTGEWRRFRDEADYAGRYPGYYSHNIAEKSFEHYMTAAVLAPGPEDVYLDIGSEHSPAGEIYGRLYGCRAYTQDLSYEPGLHGSRIGSDAAAMPVPDGMATMMALHCTLEHFEGGSDTGFFREAARVLRPGGRLVVVPLYMNSRYSVSTDLMFSHGDRVEFDPEAVVLAVDGWNNRHGRLYDPAHLVSRVVGSTPDLSFTVLRIRGVDRQRDGVYACFALVAERTRGRGA